MWWDLSAEEVEAVEAIEAALVSAHLVHPDLARAVAITASRAASPIQWSRMRRRIDQLELELGLPDSISEAVRGFD